MYNPPSFAESRPAILFDLIRQYPLGALISCTSSLEIAATHAPMLIDAESGEQGHLYCHFARANPHWELLATGTPVLVIFTGPEHYVSPSWYASKAEHGKVVPTWNYTAVHVWGKAQTFEDPQQLIGHLRQLTAANEALFPQPWTPDDAPPDYIAALAKGVVGIQIEIERLEGKWKINQNRPKDDQAGVIAGLENLGTPRSSSMADEMKRKLPWPKVT